MLSPSGATASRIISLTSSRLAADNTRELPCSWLHRKLVWSESLELVFREEHGANVFADDHAGWGLISELGLNAKPNLAEEIHRLLQISYRQIDENLLGHWFSFGNCCTDLQQYVEREPGESTEQ